VGELAVDLLRVPGVLPEVGTSRLRLELGHLSPQPIQVQDGFDPGKGGV